MVTDAGDTVVYTITVTNDGNLSLSGVVMSDPLCPPVLQSGDTTNPGVLDVGETWTYTCTYVVTQDDIDRGAIPNTASLP